MSKRTTEAYKAALKYVHENLISLNCSGFIIDYEAAMRSALLQVLPNVTVLGCWFHFTQALRRKMASLTNLYDIFRNDQTGLIRDTFRRFQCLALLPVEDIEPIFLKISEDALRISEHFAPFIDYFDQEWIKRVKPAHFSVFLKGTRTTSAAESFNARVNKSFKTHGNFYHFCEKLQIEELVSTEDLEKYVNGTIQRSYQKPFFKKRSELIHKYSMLLKNEQITPFLFLKTMANIKNKILYADSDVSLHSIEVQLSIETVLVEGSDLVALDNLTANNEDDPVGELVYARDEDSPVNISTLSELSDMEEELADNNNNGSNSQMKGKTDTQYGEIFNRLYEYCFQKFQILFFHIIFFCEIVNDAEDTVETRRKKTRATKRKATEMISTERLTRAKLRRIEDDTDNSDIFASITDSILPDIKRKIMEMKNSGNVDTEGIDCIICCKSKRTTMLLPCRHQLTCGGCWIVWAAEEVKPKCPSCTKIVKQSLNAIVA